MISYYLPKNSAKAFISVVDLNGIVVEDFQLVGPGLGQVQFNTGNLAAGTYRYSLIIDGVKIDSRIMSVVK